MYRFGEALKQIRERSDLRQADLANMVGVERSTLANWERGTKQPGLDTVVRLSEILGVSLDELAGTAKSGSTLPQTSCRMWASDPLVRLLAERTSIPAKTIAAFIVALQTASDDSADSKP